MKRIKIDFPTGAHAGPMYLPDDYGKRAPGALLALMDKIADFEARGLSEHAERLAAAVKRGIHPNDIHVTRVDESFTEARRSDRRAARRSPNLFGRFANYGGGVPRAGSKARQGFDAAELAEYNRQMNRPASQLPAADPYKKEKQETK